MPRLDLITALTTVESALRGPAGPTRAQRRELAESVARVRSSLVIAAELGGNLDRVGDAQSAFDAAVIMARRAGAGPQDLVSAFNSAIERNPR